MVASVQGAHEKEAMDKESLQMQTLGWCKRRTYLDGRANYTVSTIAIWW